MEPETPSPEPQPLPTTPEAPSFSGQQQVSGPAPLTAPVEAVEPAPLTPPEDKTAAPAGEAVAAQLPAAAEPEPVHGVTPAVAAPEAVTIEDAADDRESTLEPESPAEAAGAQHLVVEEAPSTIAAEPPGLQPEAAGDVPVPSAPIGQVTSAPSVLVGAASEGPETSALAATTVHTTPPPVVIPPAVPPAAAPTPAAPEAQAEAEIPAVVETGPNWMLAFVCGWAGGFSLWQLVELGNRPDITGLHRNYALAGYLAMGLGLFGFAVEALLWGRLKERRTQMALLILPLVLVALGVVFLLLFNDPNPSKARI